MNRLLLALGMTLIAGLALAHTASARCVRLIQSDQPSVEAIGVLLRDGEDADAALRTAGLTDEMVPTAPCCIGHRGINDLDQAL